MRRGFNVDEDYEETKPSNTGGKSRLVCCYEECRRPGVYGDGGERWICSYHKFGVSIEEALDRQRIRDTAAREVNMKKRKGPTLRDMGMIDYTEKKYAN